MNLSALYLLNPAALFLCLVILPIFCLVWYDRRLRRLQLQSFTTTNLSKLLRNRSKTMENLKLIFFTFSFCLICFSLAGPYGNFNTYSSNVQGDNLGKSQIAFLVDVSASMGVKDSNISSRLDFSKDVIESLLPQINDRPISLYALTKEFVPVVPATMDQMFFKIALKHLEINEGGIQGTDIETALEKFHPEPCTHVILFSDGGDAPLQRTSFNLIAVGVGSQEGGVVPQVLYHNQKVISKLNSDALKQLTQNFLVAEGKDVESIKDQILDLVNQRDLACSKTDFSDHLLFQTYDLYFQIPLMLGILFFVLYLCLPNTLIKQLMVFICFIPTVAECIESSIDHYNKAIELLKQENWRKSSLILDSIDPLKSPSPRFLVFLETNRAIAKLELSKITYSDSQYALYLLNQGKEDIELAIKASHMWEVRNERKLNEILELINFEIQRQTSVKTESQEKDATPPEKTLNELIDKCKTVLHQALESENKERQGQIDLKKSVEEVLNVVLKWEEEQYYRYHCQVSPWQAVIPLIQAGYEQVQMASWFEQTANRGEYFYYLNQAIIYWKQALELIRKTSNQTQNDSENPVYLLNKLEEMMLQDKRKIEKKKQTWNDW